MNILQELLPFMNRSPGELVQLVGVEVEVEVESKPGKARRADVGGITGLHP